MQPTKTLFGVPLAHVRAVMSATKATTLSAREIAMCAEMKVDPKAYVALRNARKVSR